MSENQDQEPQDHETPEFSRPVYGEPFAVYEEPMKRDIYGEPMESKEPLGVTHEEEVFSDDPDFIAAPKVEEWIQKVAQEAAERTKYLFMEMSGKGEDPLQSAPATLDPSAFLDRDLAEEHKQEVAAQAEARIEGLKKDGLYFKYRVYREPQDALSHPTPMMVTYNSLEGVGAGKSALAEEVPSFVFVLKPDSDHHARVALAAYAKSVALDKPRLHDDLMEILSDFL